MFKTRKEALKIVAGLSEPSKMPCFGYSLPRTACKVGMLLAKNPENICSKCFAGRGHYMFPHTIACLHRRLESLNDSRWVDAMVFLIKGNTYFRWHDSGDIQSIEHLQKIVDIALKTPETKHWLPTREYAMVRQFVESARMKARKAKKAIRNYIPENLTIRLSAYKFEQNPPTALAESLGVLTSGASKTDFNCPASKQKNKCGSCRMCWDKSVPNVVYKRH